MLGIVAGMRGYQHMPATGPTRRIEARLENGRWIVFRGRWRVERRDDFQMPPDPHVGGLIQLRIDTSGHGSSDEEMLRLLDMLTARWPDHVIEVMKE